MKSRRVLLLAMSGVRVKSDELRRLGMTLPGFIERGQVIASLPSLSLLTLAAHTPENWEAEYREIDELTDGAASQIASAGYDIVAISALTARILDAYEIADQLREAGITVVLGGFHVTALPDEALAHADAVVVGEAELLWLGNTNPVDPNSSNCTTIFWRWSKKRRTPQIVSERNRGRSGWRTGTATHR